MKPKKSKDTKGTPKKKKVKEEEKKTPVIEFWNPCVKVWFDFTKNKFNEKPTFDGASQAALREILKGLKDRLEDVVWTEIEATARLFRFLIMAYRDRWLREHWLLKNINQNKDQIFFNKDELKNGTHQQNTTNPPARNGKSAGATRLTSILLAEVGIKRTGE